MTGTCNASEHHDSRSDTRDRNTNRSEWNSKKRRRHATRLSENAHNLNRRNTYEVLGRSVIELRSRRVQVVGCTGHPNEAFVVQAMRYLTELIQPAARTDGVGVVRRRQLMGGMLNFYYRAAA